MKILITICARGGSKGVPGKNIKAIGDKPLIGWSIRAGKAFAERYPSDMILSTEDQAIKDAAAAHGLPTTYQRPDSLAGDGIGKVDVIREALLFAEKTNECRYDYVMDLDVTSPLRTQEDLDKGFEAFLQNEKALTLFSVNTAHRNPYFNMVEDAGGGMIKICKKLDEVVLARQAAPSVYDINGSFYFYRRAFFEEGHIGVIQDDRSMVYLMDHICFDVDTPLDFKLLKYLIEEGELGFDIG